MGAGQTDLYHGDTECHAGLVFRRRAFSQLDLAVEHAFELISEGADIIDVGGESTART